MGVRGLWLMILLLSGLLGALVSGMVFRIAGAELPASLGAGGAVLLGILTVGLTVIQVLRD